MITKEQVQAARQRCEEAEAANDEALHLLEQTSLRAATESRAYYDLRQQYLNQEGM